MDQAPESGPRSYPVQFTGQGGEYFRIWIINILLTMVTLGIYSAWAKVRTQQYFMRNTRIAGGSFDYHARPGAILLGQLVALVLLGLAYSGDVFGPWVAGPAFLLLALIWPALVQRSMRFRLGNTSWRNIRFSFVGTVGQAYRAVAPWMVAGIVVSLVGAAAGFQEDEDHRAGLTGVAMVLSFLLGLSAPVLLQRLHQYAVNHARFGNATFELVLPWHAYLRIWAGGVAWVVVPLAVLGAGVWLMSVSGDGPASPERVLGSFAGAMVLVVGIYGALLLLTLVVLPAIAARLHNRRWSATRLGQHLWVAPGLSPRRWVGLQLVNWLLVMFSAGFYRPWAAVASARLKLESATVTLAPSFMGVLQDLQRSDGAVGDELADALGIDIAF